MNWMNTVQEHMGSQNENAMDRPNKPHSDENMNCEENSSDEDDNSMTDTNERVIEQKSKNGTDEIEVWQLLGKTVSENCSVCWRSLPNDGTRSELFHITATGSNTGVTTTSFCNHCAPSHAIDVEVIVKSGGSTSRDAYVYYEIDTVFMHESEIEQ